MQKILPRSFFNRPTIEVAKNLLGKYLVRQISFGGTRRTVAAMITEVEAYDGPLDKASHAFRGRTPRTNIMFGEAGYFYIFFTYGMHWMANIVTGPKEYPAAILLRAGSSIEPKTGETVPIKGPARLAKFMDITGAFNGKPAIKKSGLWFEDPSVKIPRSKILETKRIGVDYAGPIWSEKKYNFQIVSPELFHKDKKAKQNDDNNSQYDRCDF